MKNIVISQRKSPVAKPPKWGRFFASHVNLIDFGRGASPAAVLLIQIDKRWLAISFGPAGRFLIDSDSIEERFGLLVVLNSIPENHVRRIDKTAFDALVLKYQQRVVNLVSRFVGNHADALDVTQEAFLKAYRALPNFRGDSAFYTWLYRIAVNTAKNYLAMQSRRSGELDQDISEIDQISIKSNTGVCFNLPQLGLRGLSQRYLLSHIGIH